MAGLPGTGKSHFTRELVSLSPFLVLETDRLRKALVAQPRYTPGEHRRVFGACHRLIEQFLEEGYPVLFDATNLTDRFRDPLYEIAERAGAPVAVAAITAPRETVRRRLYARKDGLDRDTNSDADWQVYCRMAPHWEPVSREHFAVDTSEDIGPVLQQVVHWAATAKPPKPPGVRAR
jgi:predicted kinase